MNRVMTPGEALPPIEEPPPIATIEIRCVEYGYKGTKEYAVSTTAAAGLDAEDLERISLTAAAAERACKGDQPRDRVGEILAEIASSLGRVQGIGPDSSIHARLEAAGNSLVAIRESLGVLAARRVHRAAARDAAPKGGRK